MRPVVPYLLMALQATATGEIPILQQPRQLTDSVNPSSVVTWDADGDGAVELLAYDPVRGRVTASTLGGKHAESPVLAVRDTFVFSSEDLAGSDLFKTDGDGVEDLMRASRGRIEIWHGKVRDLSLAQKPDWVWDFPVAPTSFPIFLPPADLDGDGYPDLLSATHGFFIFGIGTATPSIQDGGQPNLRNPQIIRDWDGAGKTVVAGQINPDVSTQVFEILANRTLRQIDQVPRSGIFVNLLGVFPPQLVQIGNFDSVSPIATVHTRSEGGVWQPDPVPNPPPLATDGPQLAFTQVLRTQPQDGRESLAIAGGSKQDIYLLEPGAEGGDPVLVRKQIQKFPGQSEALPVIGLAALEFEGLSAESLAVFKPTNPSIGAFGAFAPLGFVQGTELTVLQAGQTLPSVEFFEGLGPVGRTVPLDVDSDGRMDLVSVRTNENRINAFHQPAHPDFLVASYGFPDNIYSADMVSGNFAPGGNSRLAISPVIGNGTIGFYSLTEESLAKEGGTGSGTVLAAGDLNGNDSDDLVYIDEHAETLNHSGSLVPIAQAGRVISPFPGFFPLPPIGSGFITQDQIILADGDEDGDVDVITFPSALGQTFGFHKNDGTRFSIHHMTSVPVPIPGGFGSTIDGFDIGSPSQIFLGRFLNSSPRETLASFSKTTDIFGNPNTAFTVFSGRLDSSIAVGSTIMPSWGRTVVTDFDGDGLDDVIAVGGRVTDIFGNSRLDNSLVFYRSRGDGTFESAIVIGKTLPAEISQLIAKDMNADGMPDLIAVSAEAGSVELFLGGSVPSYPSYGEWAAIHAPSAPGELESSDSSGIPNLIRYATGGIPGNSQSAPPSAPPSAPVVEFNGFSFDASHPIPRLENGDAVDARIEYSYDLSTWRAAFDSPVFTNDPEFPQWKTKTWTRVFLTDENGNSLNTSTEKVFFRFAVTLRSGE